MPLEHDMAVGAERAASPKNKKKPSKEEEQGEEATRPSAQWPVGGAPHQKEEDNESNGSLSDNGIGWEAQSGATFKFSTIPFRAGGREEEEEEKQQQTPATGTMTPPPQFSEGVNAGDPSNVRSPGDRNNRGFDDARMAQSWPLRTPGPSALDSEEPQEEVSGFTLDPSEAPKQQQQQQQPPQQQQPGPGLPPAGLLARAPVPPKRTKQVAAAACQTDPSDEPRVAYDNETTVYNSSDVFCSVVLNGTQTLQCNVPTSETGITLAEARLKEEVSLYGEGSGLFLQLVFYSPNFPAKPDYHIHGTLELMDKDGQVISSIYLGLIEEQSQVEKKQHTVGGAPVQARVTLSAIPPFRLGPNEMQLVDEICDVLRNSRINPGRGSLPSVLVQHRAKESPLYEKVVGKYFQSSWHTFMKAHDDVFTLFHYSQKEIQERRLGPFAKFNEARIVLKEHEKGDWKAADEMAALRHAQAEEGLKNFLVQLLEKRDYDQRELLEVLHGNAHFNHFLSPTFSILMRTLCRHKGTFITSSDGDQPTRIGLSRPDQTSIEHTGANENHLNGHFPDFNTQRFAQPLQRGNTIQEQQQQQQIQQQIQQQQQQHHHQHQASQQGLLQFSMFDTQQQQQQQQQQHHQQQQQQFQHFVSSMQGKGHQQHDGFSRLKLNERESDVGTLMQDLGIPQDHREADKPLQQQHRHQQLQQRWVDKERHGEQVEVVNGIVSGQDKGVDAVLMAAAVPVQPAPQGQQIIFDNSSRFILQQPHVQQAAPSAPQGQQVVQVGGFSGNGQLLLEGQPATVVLLKPGQQVQPQPIQQFSGQQVLLVNHQPTGQDSNWVVHQAPQGHLATPPGNFLVATTPPAAPALPPGSAASETLYPPALQATPPSAPLGSNPNTPSDSGLQPSFYPYVMSTTTAY